MNVECINEKNNIEDQISISTGFLHFLEENLSPDDLELINNHQKFNQLISNYKDYGDAVFQDLVNFTSKLLELPIKDIIIKYANYRNTELID